MPQGEGRNYGMEVKREGFSHLLDRLFGLSSSMDLGTYHWCFLREPMLFTWYPKRGFGVKAI